ncbi:hypothetical protein [Candidatus Rickettsia colombianensi]|uniref:hypothetical protein n=1 Tax=Candidatus Rickettsia colombianensi TaxID=1090944 RepID=UPI001FE46090|nr:hypothetical protein [Candidatus Rickettsia colombianensi]
MTRIVSFIFWFILNVIPWLDHGVQKNDLLYCYFHWIPWSSHGMTMSTSSTSLPSQ